MPKRIAEILKRLDEAYGTEYVCYLNHETPWQLLIAVILSAQCTDCLLYTSPSPRDTR